MSDFPSMHARDATKLPHVSLEELSARVPRASVLPFTRTKGYDPAKGPVQTHKGKGAMSDEERRTRNRDRKRRMTLLAHSKGGARPGAGRPRKENHE
jgi:hypothetical protein